jgi:hypothetical protein
MLNGQLLLAGAALTYMFLRDLAFSCGQTAGREPRQQKPDFLVPVAFMKSDHFPPLVSVGGELPPNTGSSFCNFARA